jgi:transposase
MHHLVSKLFWAVASCDRDPYEALDYSHDITLEPTTVGSILETLNAYDLSLHGLIKVDPKGLSKESIDALKEMGWVHPSTVKSRNERKELEQHFWLLVASGNYGSYPTFEKLDLDNISDYQIEKLVERNGDIVQKVSVKSVLPEKAYKRYLAAKKKKEEKDLKKKLSAEKKKAEKKAKEVAQAKQLLIEAGELTPEEES